MEIDERNKLHSLQHGQQTPEQHGQRTPEQHERDSERRRLSYAGKKMKAASSNLCTGSATSMPRKRGHPRLIDTPVVDPWVLPSVHSCINCGVFRFHHEVPGFCYGEG